jgi:hypothetical protein
MIRSPLFLPRLKAEPARSTWITATLFVIMGCTSPTWAQSIIIEREVMLEKGNDVTPSAIISTSDGGFVITGLSNGQTAAWATRVNAQGEVLWRYLDTRIENPRGRSQSVFKGAVMLPDDSVLLCGSKILSTGQVGLLTRIDASGSVKEQKNLYPKADEKLHWARFDRCIPWSDGIALVGTVAGEPKAVGWLIKLDARGQQQWEIIGPDFIADDAIETSDHSLILASADIGTFKVALVRVDSLGHAKARRIIACKSACGKFVLFHHSPLTPPPRTFAFATVEQHTTALYELDLNINDIRPVKNIDSIVPKRGYKLADGSLVTFGSTETGGVYNASIGLVGAKGGLTVYNFPPIWSANGLQIDEESVAVEDAIPLSEQKFVAVHDWMANKREKIGFFMDWVSFK